MKPEGVRTKHWVIYNFLFFVEHFLGHNLYTRLFGNFEKKLFTAIEGSLTKKRNNNFKLIEYQTNQWDEAVLASYNPKIFRGVAKKWDCSKKWTFDFFLEQFGNEDVTIIDNPGLVEASQKQADKIKLSDYIDLLKKGSSKYLKFSRFIQHNSRLKNDINYDWLKKFRTKFSMGGITYLFIGGKKTLTPIHNGMSRTIFVQVRGSKKWIFYPPEERIFIGARPTRMNYFFTDAKLKNNDKAKFPLFEHAKPIEVIVNEGDVLYIPPLVWHHVENLTDTIGFAYKLADIGSSFKSSKLMTALFFLSTKPFFFKTTSHIKNKDDGYGN